MGKILNADPTRITVLAFQTVAQDIQAAMLRTGGSITLQWICGGEHRFQGGWDLECRALSKAHFVCRELQELLV